MRKVTSIILAIAFIIVSVSGLELATGHKPPSVHQQMVSSSLGNKTAVVKQEQPFYPKKAHEWFGYLFIGAGVVHIVLNKRPMLSYLKTKRK